MQANILVGTDLDLMVRLNAMGFHGVTSELEKELTFVDRSNMGAVLLRKAIVEIFTQLDRSRHPSAKFQPLLSDQEHDL